MERLIARWQEKDGCKTGDDGCARRPEGRSAALVRARDMEMARAEDGTSFWQKKKIMTKRSEKAVSRGEDDCTSTVVNYIYEIYIISSLYTRRIGNTMYTRNLAMIFVLFYCCRVAIVAR